MSNTENGEENVVRLWSGRTVSIDCRKEMVDISRALGAYRVQQPQPDQNPRSFANHQLKVVGNQSG